MCWQRAWLVNSVSIVDWWLFTTDCALHVQQPGHSAQQQDVSILQTNPPRQLQVFNVQLQTASLVTADIICICCTCLSPAPDCRLNLLRNWQPRPTTHMGIHSGDSTPVLRELAKYCHACLLVTHGLGPPAAATPWPKGSLFPGLHPCPSPDIPLAPHLSAGPRPPTLRKASAPPPQRCS